MAHTAYSRREFAGGAAATTVTAGLAGASSAPGETFSIAASTGWPTGATGKFTVVVDRGLATEEKVLCLSRSSLVVTIDTRGFDGTTGVGHTAGATVELCITATDVDEANKAVSETVGKVTTKGDMLAASSTATFSRVAAGANYTVVQADSAQSAGVKFALLEPQNITGLSGIAKGSLATATASNTFSTLPVGADNYVLIADSTEGTGLIWGKANAASIDDNAVISQHIVDWTAGFPTLYGIQTAHLADDAVTADKLADDAVVHASHADEARSTYVPTMTAASGAAPDLGNGTITGRYYVQGKEAFLNIQLEAGTTTDFKTGRLRFSLPVGWDTKDSITQPVSVAVWDSSTGLVETSSGVAFGDQTYIQTNVKFDTPVTLAVNDRIVIQAHLELE